MIIRDREVETCFVCKQEFDKLKLEEVFTGRVKYICPECRNLGSREVEARQTEWRKSAKGKAIIAMLDKNK